VVEFVRVTEGLVATRLAIHVDASGEAGSRVHIAYTFTPLSPAGVAFVETNYTEQSFHRDMAWWEESMIHWLSTGDILTADALTPVPSSHGNKAEAPTSG